MQLTILVCATDETRAVGPISQRRFNANLRMNLIQETNAQRTIILVCSANAVIGRVKAAQAYMYRRIEERKRTTGKVEEASHNEDEKRLMSFISSRRQIARFRRPISQITPRAPQGARGFPSSKTLAKASTVLGGIAQVGSGKYLPDLGNEFLPTTLSGGSRTFRRH